MEESPRIKNQKAEPMWIELSKNNYRDHLNKLRIVTHNNVKFNILENVGVIKVSTNEDYIASVFFLFLN